MRAEVKRSFIDLKENRERPVGEVFELSEERFAEINRKLNGYIVETDKALTSEPADKPAAKTRVKRRTPANKAKTTENK